MRINENQYSTVKWAGKLGAPAGDRESVTYRIDPYQRQELMLGVHGAETHLHVMFRDIPRLLNFWRDLGEAIEYLQPGVINPLPEGDPSEVDAMKVIWTADDLRKGTR